MWKSISTPEGSGFANKSAFEELQADILFLSQFGELPVCLLGDFNARTKNLNDWILLEDNNDEVNMLLCNDMFAEDNLLNADILQRHNSDTTVINNYGRNLIELCQSLNIYIVNGLCGKLALITNI